MEFRFERRILREAISLPKSRDRAALCEPELPRDAALQAVLLTPPLIATTPESATKANSMFAREGGPLKARPFR